MRGGKREGGRRGGAKGAGRGGEGPRRRPRTLSGNSRPLPSERGKLEEAYVVEGDLGELLGLELERELDERVVALPGARARRRRHGRLDTVLVLFAARALGVDAHHALGEGGGVRDLEDGLVLVRHASRSQSLQTRSKR